MPITDALKKRLESKGIAVPNETNDENESAKKDANVQYLIRQIADCPLKVKTFH
ncbi:MAG: hypothetical protein MHPSP_003774, partial [Paramarteilia canceri]